jgi:hypothetical protein
MFTFFINPAILWLILFFVARKQGDTSYSTLFYVSLGITILAFVLALYVPQFAIFILPVVCVLAVKRFCYIGWLRAIIATILFMVWVMLWPVLFHQVIH